MEIVVTDQSAMVPSLVNLGNTCFMNSTLQCLYHTVPLRSYFLQNKDDSCNEKKVSPKFHELLRVMSNGEYSYLALLELKEVIGQVASRFCGWNQEDAQEFLVFLLDSLHEDENEVREKKYVRMTTEVDKKHSEKDIADMWWGKYLQQNKSEIVCIFHGQNRTQTTCLRDSSHTEVMFEPISQLNLPLPKNNDPTPMYLAATMEMDSENHIDIDQCLKLYNEEKFSSDQYWFCSKYNDVVQSSRKIELWKLPGILIIHLKRFSVTNSMHRKKNRMVTFPFVLNLDEYIAEDSEDKGTIYDLYGVVNHRGELYFGHYYSYVKSEQKWYCCDDSYIYEMVSPEAVMTQNAYILFYERAASQL